VRSTADLREYLDALDLCYFDGQLAEDYPELGIRWMRARTSARFGQYSEARGIEISRVLAYPWVPPFFVLSVVYHEALHAVIGLEHCYRFRQAERAYARWYEASVWEHENCARLLAAEPPKGLR